MPAWLIRRERLQNRRRETPDAHRSSPREHPVRDGMDSTESLAFQIIGYPQLDRLVSGSRSVDMHARANTSDGEHRNGA
jgi:hypothetical protein